MGVTSFTESTVGEAAVAWLESLGWTVKHGPEIAPGEPFAERDDYREVVLKQRLWDALARLNSDLSHDALEDAFRKLTNPEGSTLEARNRASHRMLVGRHDSGTQRENCHAAHYSSTGEGEAGTVCSAGTPASQQPARISARPSVRRTAHHRLCSRSRARARRRRSTFSSSRRCNSLLLLRAAGRLTLFTETTNEELNVRHPARARSLVASIPAPFPLPGAPSGVRELEHTAVLGVMSSLQATSGWSRGAMPERL